MTRLIGVALFAYFLLILGGHHYSIDGIVMFQTAKRLFFHHSLVLDPPVLWGTSVIRASRWSLGLTLAYLPPLALASPLFYWLPSLQEIPYNPSLPYNPALYSNLPYLLCSWLNPLITALTGCLVFRLARLLGLTPPWAVAAALAYGVASPAAAYARFDYAQPLAALVLTAAVWRLLTASPAFLLRPLFLTGAILGFAFLTRPEFAVLIAWILAWMLFRCRAMSRRAVLERVAVLAGPVGIAVGIYFATNWFMFGGPFDTGHKPFARLFPGSPTGALQGVIGLLASPDHGLLFFCPLAWLALPGLVRLIKERNPAGALFAGLSGAAFVLYGSFGRGWGGGVSWGPRFLISIVPLVIVASAFWAFRAWGSGRRGGRTLFLTLGALGVVVTWTGILVDPVLYVAWIRHPVGFAARLGQLGAADFRLLASPLVTGWAFLWAAPLDFPLVMLWRAGRVATVLVWLVATLAVTAGLAWAGYRIRVLLRESRAGNGGG